MNHLRLHVAAILGLGLLSVGCGKGTTTSLGATPASVGQAIGPKELPAEYRTLASTVLLSLRPSPDQFRDSQSLSEIIAEGHAGIMALRGIQSSDPDITYIANEGAAACTE